MWMNAKIKGRSIPGGGNELCLWEFVGRAVWVQILLPTVGFSLPFYAFCHNTYLTCSTHIYLTPEIFFVLLAPSLCPTQFILNPAARIICPEWFHHVTWQSRSPDGSLLQLSPLVPHKHLLESWYVSDTSPGTAYTLMHNKDRVLLSPSYILEE